jgi:hypothetical protein
MRTLELRMTITRRTLLIAAGMLLSPPLRAADAENVLYWTVTPPGRKAAVLFGYERVAAALVPEIVRDGEALVRNSQRVVIDMPQDVQLQTVGLGRNEIRPILQVVSPQTADRLRKFLGTTPAAALVDRAGGLEVVMLLMAEGQHGANATVGGAIFEYARSDGKPVNQLLSEADVQSAWRPQDLASLDSGIGEDTISYLLDMRDRVGPLGGYFEQLYRQRKGEEIVRVTEDMNRHGVLSPSHLLETDRMRDMMFDRAFNLLTEQADEQRFMLFPLGILVGPSGLLAQFKMKGATVAPLA